ncbi:hypothetical protein PWT90_10091 [Aphanocladium album]|nr:hypothetical protein PWT90_10091 [Aphanocladium album]
MRNANCRKKVPLRKQAEKLLRLQPAARRGTVSVGLSRRAALQAHPCLRCRCYGAAALGKSAVEAPESSPKLPTVRRCYDEIRSALRATTAVLRHHHLPASFFFFLFSHPFIASIASTTPKNDSNEKLYTNPIMSSPAAIIGSTGLVGSHILSTILATGTHKPVSTITRREPKSSSPDLHAVVDADTTKWASLLSGLAPAATAVFSALGTTRAAAGGIQNQWKIDHDLNVELARAAKAAGAKTFVFISSGGTRGLLSSSVPYSKMKNGVEDAIKELDFEHGIILKPGVILGEREQSRTAESWFQSLTHGLGKVSPAAKNFLGQDAEVIARAAVRAAQLAEEGKAPSKYWVVEASDIIRLGQTEWKEAEKPAA